ncbi:MAG: hypothetical protein Q8K82_04970 [Gemmatimonadaceae bacterium]|nr:hypothetical protein [Gemmatimonadaceae bacterium]
MTHSLMLWLAVGGSAVVVAPAAAVRMPAISAVKAPAVILVEGASLPRRVALARRQDNIQLFAAMTAAVATTVSSAARPAPLRIALFWQPTLPGAPLTDAFIARLRFEDADHLGFLVPATRSSPPLLVIDYPAPTGRTFRAIHEPGLRILAAHGIHLRDGGRP